MSSGNDVIVQIKGNQPSLHKDCQTTASNLVPHEIHEEEIIQKRGRREKRTTEIYRNFTTTDAQWNLIEEMIVVKRHREVFHTKEKKWKPSHETSYYVSTCSLTAQTYSQAIRNHWRIENCHHYVRDHAFHEDQSRIRKNPSKIARFRSWALNILRVNKEQNITQALYENSLNLKKVLAYKGI